MVPYVTSVNLLQWALDELEMPKRLVCGTIAYSGHLDMLKWARAQNPPCDWNAWVCIHAAYNGHLDVLQWARAQDPPCAWDERVCINVPSNIIEWLRSQNTPSHWPI